MGHGSISLNYYKDCSCCHHQFLLLCSCPHRLEIKATIPKTFKSDLFTTIKRFEVGYNYHHQTGPKLETILRCLQKGILRFSTSNSHPL